jgi:hypothetical protein
MHHDGRFQPQYARVQSIAPDAPELRSTVGRLTNARDDWQEPWLSGDVTDEAAHEKRTKTPT